MIPKNEFSLLYSSIEWGFFNYSFDCRIDDKKKVKNIFGNDINPIIVVNNIKSLTGS